MRGRRGARDAGALQGRDGGRGQRLGARAYELRISYPVVLVFLDWLPWAVAATVVAIW